MIIYAIRLKGTDKYLPYWYKEGNRIKKGSYSFTEPTNEIPPRFFVTKASAVNALTAWLSGKWAWRGANYIDGPEYNLEPKTITTRKKELMEIVSFKIKEIKCRK